MPELCSQCKVGLWSYLAAMWFAGLFTVAHLIALPFSISYDGFLYLDMADVLFSPRFPQDWFVARTPLYPLTLKVAFWLLGRTATTAVAVSSMMGLAAILVLGSSLRRVAGEIPAAIALVLLSVFPTLVTYEHLMLTETGTFLFLVLVVALLLWSPQAARGLWAKALLLVVAVTAGFYWRQTLLPLAVVAGALHGVAAWKYFRPSAAPWSFRRLVAVTAQMAVIAALPYGLAKFWDPYTGNGDFLRRLMLNQGIITQALLPPDHPYLGDKAKLYREAIAEGEAFGNFYSGLTGLPQHAELTAALPRAWEGRNGSFFLELIWQYPGRYCAAVGRMMMLTAGCRARINENVLARSAILDPTWHTETNTICGGPPHLEAAVKKQFSQPCTPSYLMRRLWKIGKGFDRLVVLSMAVAVVGAIAGLVLRSLPLVTLYGVALAFQVPYVLVLTTVDRYAFPTQAVALAALPAFPVLVWKAIAACRRRPASSFTDASSPAPEPTS